MSKYIRLKTVRWNEAGQAQHATIRVSRWEKYSCDRLYANEILPGGLFGDPIGHIDLKNGLWFPNPERSCSAARRAAELAILTESADKLLADSSGPAI